MTTVNHLVPANILGVTAALNPVTGAYVDQDVSRGFYAQTSASPVAPTRVGYIPATADGLGGLNQLARDVNARFLSNISLASFSASLSGTTLTVNYPNVNVLWDGAVRTLHAGSVVGTVATGLYSFVVGYNWGLTQVAIVAQSAFVLPLTYIEIVQINVNIATPSATLLIGRSNGIFLRSLGIVGPSGASNANAIPVSKADGTLTW
jgi:hypothetical protein